MFSIKHLGFVVKILDNRLQVLNDKKFHYGLEAELCKNTDLENSDLENEIEFYLSLRNQVTSKIQQMETVLENA
jgi:hypothetical protein